MISAVAILLVLPGQNLSTTTSNAVFPFHRVWEMDPGIAAQPTTPSVHQGWDRQKETTFAYTKCDVNTAGDTISRDTVSILWDPVARFYSYQFPVKDTIT